MDRLARPEGPHQPISQKIAVDVPFAQLHSHKGLRVRWPSKRVACSKGDTAGKERSRRDAHYRRRHHERGLFRLSGLRCSPRSSWPPALVFLIGGRHYFSLQTLAEHRLALRALVADNYLLAILGYLAVYTTAIALLFPTAAVLTLTGGFLFGWQVGFPLTVIAATSGATIVFLLAKTTLGEPLARRTGPWLCKVRSGFQEDAFIYLLFLRLVPAFPFWFMNLAPALLGVSIRDFVLATGNRHHSRHARLLHYRLRAGRDFDQASSRLSRLPGAACRPRSRPAGSIFRPALSSRPSWWPRWFCSALSRSCPQS